MGQHTSAAREVLKARVDQHQVIAGGGASPSLEDASKMVATDGVSFPATLSMARRSHAWMRVVLDTLIVQDHSTIQDVNEELLEWESELEEYNPRDRGLNTRLPALITHWIQILVLGWFSQQWVRGVGGGSQT